MRNPPSSSARDFNGESRGILRRALPLHRPAAPGAPPALDDRATKPNDQSGRSHDRRHQRLQVPRRLEQVVGILRAKALRRGLAGGDGDRGGGVWDSTAHVIDRVADDHHVASAEVVTEGFGGSADGNGRELLARFGVAAEGAEWEELIEASLSKLDPRACLEVARQQSERYLRIGAQRL